MSFYSSIYFYSDQSLSTVPKSRCALRGPFEAGQEAEVKWAGQRFSGIILKTADKGKLLCFNLYLRLVLFFLLPCSMFVVSVIIVQHKEHKGRCFHKIKTYLFL